MSVMKSIIKEVKGVKGAKSVDVWKKNIWGTNLRKRKNLQVEACLLCSRKCKKIHFGRVIRNSFEKNCERANHMRTFSPCKAFGFNLKEVRSFGIVLSRAMAWSVLNFGRIIVAYWLRKTVQGISRWRDTSWEAKEIT